ncbi:hypothetical protein QYE76_042641 [Lolium multiflorum]|uniref:Phytocyanin domain-containing protein n=1 Tax=Lolium multiflorum TaxID=4521 RepID=A0AAD8TH64_LOLMU|nr:hypothetical protein QYE76_042641 [Lolium multiflorum]
MGRPVGDALSPCSVKTWLPCHRVNKEQTRRYADASGATTDPCPLIVFTYTAGQHTVVEVTGAGFKACDMTGNAMLGSWNSGSDTINLDTAGRRWFICGVGSHCAQGMKLLVVTTGDNKTSSASLNYNVGAGAAALVAGAAAALLF